VPEEDDKPRAVCKGLKIITATGRVLEVVVEHRDRARADALEELEK
jgi:hypothetical protein